MVKPLIAFEGPQIKGNSFGGTNFTLHALSRRVSVNNSSSVKIISRSNMLFSSPGFTRATPYIAPPPTIHGFSEILPNTTFIDSGDGRQIYASQSDVLTDDIYLFDSVTGTNQRVSLSTFGFPTNYLNSGITSMPSNRFPSISGNGRYVLFSTDASGTGSLVFNGSNQLPADTNNNARLFCETAKISSLTRPIINVDMLFPNRNLSHNFCSQCSNTDCRSN